MTEYADVYADGFSISAGEFGVTVTLTVSDPTGEPGPHEEPNHPVARIRMSMALAEELTKMMSLTISQSRSGQPSSQGTTH
jgi:hypothetical protein